jgi:hypothetical protein
MYRRLLSLRLTDAAKWLKSNWPVTGVGTGWQPVLLELKLILALMGVNPRSSIVDLGSYTLSEFSVG